MRWTHELPKDEGFYFVKIRNDKYDYEQVQVVKVYRSDAAGDALTVEWWNGETRLSTYEGDKSHTWSDLPIPEPEACR